MNPEEFQRASTRAEVLGRAEPERADYWRGFRRGLRRAHFGAIFGTDAEHQAWIAAAHSTDRQRAERGRGYHDGLAAAERPTC